MIKQEINELKRLYTPSNCSITRICGCYVDGERLKRLKGTDSTADNVVIHIAEVSSNYNCRLECFLTDEHFVILSMIGGVNEVTL